MRVCCFGWFWMTTLITLSVGCVTPTIRRDELTALDHVALVSVHGTTDVGLQDAQLGPTFAQNTVGEEVLELMLPTIEGQVEVLFGEGRVLLPKAVMRSKFYDAVPEALPATSWTQLNNMLAVDIDSELTPAALGALARDLDVDATIVVRHEWFLSRDSYDRSFTIWAWDRCTILVVGRRGDILWRETTTAREPLQMVWGLGTIGGINGTVQLDQTRQLARSTAHTAWAELEANFRALTPPAAPPAPLSTTSGPPPPLAPTP
jgi:hypothetical protein